MAGHGARGADVDFALGRLRAGATFWGVGTTLQRSFVASRLAEIPSKAPAPNVENWHTGGAGAQNGGRAAEPEGWAGLWVGWGDFLPKGGERETHLGGQILEFVLPQPFQHCWLQLGLGRVNKRAMSGIDGQTHQGSCTKRCAKRDKSGPTRWRARARELPVAI